MHRHTEEHPTRNEDEYFARENAQLIKEMRTLLDEQRREVPVDFLGLFEHRTKQPHIKRSRRDDPVVVRIGFLLQPLDLPLLDDDRGPVLVQVAVQLGDLLPRLLELEFGREARNRSRGGFFVA